MLSLRRTTTVLLSAILALSPVTVATAAVATVTAAPPTESPDLSEQDATARLRQQDAAHRVLDHLPTGVRAAAAGTWFDATTGSLTVAVTDRASAEAARAAGAAAVLVGRDRAALTRLTTLVRDRSAGVPGIASFGVDDRANEVVVSVDRTRANAATRHLVAELRGIDGVRVDEADSSPRPQAGDVRPGSPWWPGSESNCSIGFAATDGAGAEHMLTAGHCSNDTDQAAYGAYGQQNRIGTSNVGGTRSVNNREGDMGVVAVTEAGWNLSASVNTWGGAAVTVTGSAEAIVGDSVCHSGNTSKWQCGTVTYVNQTVDYGGGLVIEGLTFSTACSRGGDSGGAWLRGTLAVGLHDGGPAQCVADPGRNDQSIFQPVNEALRKWNLTLYTGTPSGDTTPPSTPTGLTASGATSTTASLSWTASTDDTGVTGYDVYTGGTLATSVATTSATLSGLTPDTGYSVTVRARDAAGNVSPASTAVSVRTQPGSGGGRTFANGTDFALRDFQVAVSPVSSTATGRAASPVRVAVTATHTCLQDLQVSVVSPSGWRYTLQNSGGSGCTAWPGTRTFSFTPFNEQAAGTWTLRVGDNGPGDTGVLDSWSITL